LTFHDIGILPSTPTFPDTGSQPPVAVVISESGDWEDGQIVPVSISHDGDYAIATCMSYEPSPGSVFETAEDVSKAMGVMEHGGSQKAEEIKKNSLARDTDKGHLETVELAAVRYIRVGGSLTELNLRIKKRLLLARRKAYEKSKSVRTFHPETDPDGELVALKSAGMDPPSRKATIPLAEQNLPLHSGKRKVSLAGQKLNEEPEPIHNFHQVNTNKELLGVLKAARINPYSRKATIPLARQNLDLLPGTRSVSLDGQKFDEKGEGLRDAEAPDDSIAKSRMAGGLRETWFTRLGPSFSERSAQYSDEVTASGDANAGEAVVDSALAFESASKDANSDRTAEENLEASRLERLRGTKN
jgi:hypothetical protein